MKVGQSPEVSERILVAAMEHFARRGYAAAALREIAITAGVTKPMIYYYFGSKDGLYRSVLDVAHDDLERDLEQAVSTAIPPKDQFAAVVGAMLRYGAEHEPSRRCVAIAAGPARGGPAMDAQRFRALLKRTLGGVMTHRQAEGVMRPPDTEVLAEVLYALLLAAPESVDGAYVERIVSLLWHGIAAMP
jgi:TetR/AcrR family transcriptional regulator